MKLLLIEVGLLNKKGQYAKIKVVQKSKKVEEIKTNIVGQKIERPLRSPLISNTMASNKLSSLSIIIVIIFNI